jgi:hypothetical protein
VRKENDYILRSPSGLVLKGRIGGRFAFDSVKCGDVDCGPFTFMLYNGEYRDIDRVDSVEWHSNRGVLRAVGSAKNGRSSFRIKCDIVPFSEKQWFACNVVEVENTGKEEFTDVSVLLRQYAPWAKDWLDPQTCKPVPDLWKSPPSYAWFRKSDSVWFGAATFAKTVLNFRYYVSPDGGSHPDATFNATGDASKPFPIKAGRTWKPYGAIWMVAAFGKGGLNGWNGFLDEFSTWYEHASR